MKVLYRGLVTRVDTNGAWVEIPHIATGHDFGPLQVPTNLPLMTSDRVLVGKIEEIDEDFVIVAKIGNTGEPPYPAGHTHDDKVDRAAIATKEPTERPETYPLGLSQFEVSSSATWPAAFGVVETNFINVNRARQTFTQKTTGVQWTRTADNALTNGWSSWVRSAATGEAPTTHTHDDRYYTETELNNGQLDSRYYTEAESDARFPYRVRLAGGSGVTSWLRVATVNGASAVNGSEITLLISGQGSIGQAQRCIDIVTLGQRGDNGFAWEAWHFGSSLSPWTFYYKQINTWQYELWAKRTGYDSNVSVQVLSQGGGTGTGLNLDQSTTTDPGAAITALPIPVNVDQISRNAVVRVVHGSNAATARPIWATYVEWLGSVQPNNMTAVDTWVNNAP